MSLTAGRHIRREIMKILSVVGARPQFVKLAPVSHALDAASHEHLIVHTGQHYDANMSDVFFEDLGVPAPDVNLSIGSSSHGRQTGAMLAALDEVLEDARPDWVLVYGDTNSTTAGALAAVKMHLPVAHLEAGLRSFNRRMPEEHNRVVTDHLADLCLAPTETAMQHLRDEGLGARSTLVGDVMTDVLFRVKAQVERSDGPVVGALGGRPYRVATLHRPDNTDDPERLAGIIHALAGLSAPTLLLAHPRLKARAEEFGIALEQGNIVVTEPLSYPELIRTVLGSIGVITDSGGLQKEAFLLRTPCITVRPETEWVETVDLGWNTLAPHPADLDRAANAELPTATEETPYGDGHAAQRVVAVLEETSRS
jgi:UDP-N-acetylglucosamine 2-epimerase (non-hydrolysing)